MTAKKKPRKIYVYAVLTGSCLQKSDAFVLRKNARSEAAEYKRIGLAAIVVRCVGVLR